MLLLEACNSGWAPFHVNASFFVVALFNEDLGDCLLSGCISEIDSVMQD